MNRYSTSSKVPMLSSQRQASLLLLSTSTPPILNGNTLLATGDDRWRHEIGGSEMNKNTVLSLPQVTVDYTFMVPDHIERICGEFCNRKFFPDEVREVLDNISKL